MFDYIEILFHESAYGTPLQKILFWITMTILPLQTVLGTPLQKLLFCITITVLPLQTVPVHLQNCEKIGIENTITDTLPLPT